MFCSEKSAGAFLSTEPLPSPIGPDREREREDDGRKEQEQRDATVLPASQAKLIVSFEPQAASEELHPGPPLGRAAASCGAPDAAASSWPAAAAPLNLRRRHRHECQGGLG